ncbi:MAG: YtxH domain-containing protein [Muribaculaceae bacterium]|jgi:gas vesicle protein|nr:YtxH domain-containing protein [Muribaculaceae bacterium]
MKGLSTFLLGAAVGAAAAALLTPTTGEELRARIKAILQKHGIIAADDIDELVDMIACQVEDSSKAKKA